MTRLVWRVLLGLFVASHGAVAQEVRVRPAPRINLPGRVDGNSPLFWYNAQCHIFTSIGSPQLLSTGPGQFGPWETIEVNRGSLTASAIWIEAAWRDTDGTIYGWYHQEPIPLSPHSPLTAPKIGAVVSYDGGRSIVDLGIILESGDPLDPAARNGFFSGGHGDFSVIVDREHEYFYFLYSNYGGRAHEQGIALARMAFADRAAPVGKIVKYSPAGWNEPGRGGRVTPVWPVRRDWRWADPDAFWGPAIHWNYHLDCYVILMNRAAGLPGWSQEGIYLSFAADLTVPEEWTEPVKILDRADLPNWHTFYPQVVGLEEGGTDRFAGGLARLFVDGTSLWEIEFTSPALPLADRNVKRPSGPPRR